MRGQLDPLDVLAEASRLLASSFELSATLPKVAELCVERIADYCAIHAHLGESGASLVEASRTQDEHLPAHDPLELPDVMREHGYESVAWAPMTGRHVRGVFALGSRSDVAFDDDIQKLVKILALQLANVLDQSVFHERTHRVADRLQRALLPEKLPSLPGMTFDAAYRPASDEAEVGGDWFDAFTLPDGRVAISMGDVAGHGLEAAAIMGEIRQAMRTTAVLGHSSAHVLERINSVINLRSGIGMVTAIFGYFIPERRELTYAVAGHPPPILTSAGGFSGFLPGGGLPLGVGPTTHATDTTLTIPPQSCVIFYTDGMTEYSRDILAGEEALLEAAVRSFSEDPEYPAIALQERVFDASRNRDDAATLTLSCTGGGLPSEWRYSAMPIAAPIVRTMLKHFCDDNHVEPEQTFALVTAVGEAVANSVEHAYRGDRSGFFTIKAFIDSSHITIEIEDGGKWRPYEPRDERGRGMILMYELMDRVRITSAHNGTNIALVLNRHA